MRQFTFEIYLSILIFSEKALSQSNLSKPSIFSANPPLTQTPKVPEILPIKMARVIIAANQEAPNVPEGISMAELVTIAKSNSHTLTRED